MSPQAFDFRSLFNFAGKTDFNDPHDLVIWTVSCALCTFLSLCRAVEAAIADPKEQARFGKLRTVKEKHRRLVQKIEVLPRQEKRNNLPESLDVTLSSLYDLIRRQRNELGHPQAQPPMIDRELAFTYFKLFPTFINDAEALAAYCGTAGF